MSDRNRKSPASPKRGVPAWIVSFSDMITLLLAFFVLLQSFAQEQHPEKFFVGQGSFRRAIGGLGLPSWLTGREDRLDNDYILPVNPTPEAPPDQPKQRIIDSLDDKIRKQFQDAARDMENEATAVSQNVLDIFATPVTFAEKDVTLDERARAILSRQLNGITTLSPKRTINIYVVGMAFDSVDEQQKWILSARRAAAAEKYLRDRLGKTYLVDGNWRTSSWGEGVGRPKSKSWPIDPGQTSIVIVVSEETVVSEEGGPNG